MKPDWYSTLDGLQNLGIRWSLDIETEPKIDVTVFGSTGPMYIAGPVTYRLRVEVDGHDLEFEGESYDNVVGQALGALFQ